LRHAPRMFMTTVGFLIAISLAACPAIVLHAGVEPASDRLEGDHLSATYGA